MNFAWTKWTTLRLGKVHRMLLNASKVGRPGFCVSTFSRIRRLAHSFSNLPDLCCVVMVDWTWDHQLIPKLYILRWINSHKAAKDPTVMTGSFTQLKFRVSQAIFPQGRVSKRFQLLWSTHVLILCVITQISWLVRWGSLSALWELTEWVNYKSYTDFPLKHLLSGI